jgi:Phage virion morphogenesis family
MARSAFTVDLELHGDSIYRRAFEALGDAAEDMREPLGLIGERLLAGIERQFETEGAAGGSRWAPLESGYAIWKAEHFPGKPILQRSGLLKQTLTSRRALTVTRERLSYEPDGSYPGGTEVDVVAGAHHGGVAGHGLPARPIVQVGPAEKRSWDRIWADWLREIQRPPLR